MTGKQTTKYTLLVYMVIVHLALVLVLVKSDFIDLTLNKFGYSNNINELGKFYHQMLSYHKRVDRNIPEQAVLFIGDSHIQGLAVGAVYPNSYNFGIGMDTTRGVLKRIPEYQSLQRARLIVINIGFNDIKYRQNPEIIRNYDNILALIPEHIPVILISIPPVAKDVENSSGLNSRIVDINESINSMSKNRSRIMYLDIHAALKSSDKNVSGEYHTDDGIHLNAKGNQILIQHLKNLINNKIKD